MKPLLAGCLVLLLAACVGREARPPAPFDAGPVRMACTDACLTPCTPEPGAWPRWTCNPDDPGCWDERTEQTELALKEIAQRCEAARASCLRCIHGIERSGLVCGVNEPCGGVP